MPSPSPSRISPMRRFIGALRLDDLFALLFTSFLLVLSIREKPVFDFGVLRGVGFLLAWYGGFFAFGRWLARTPRLTSVQRKTMLAWLILLIGAFVFIIPGRDMMFLEKPKYLLVALLPLLLAWWLTNPAEEEGEPVPSATPVYRVLRDFAPFLVSLGSYLLLHDLIHTISPVDRDDWLIAADEALFGEPLTLRLEPYVNIYLTEWFSMTYSLYLIFPLTLALYFVAKGQRRALLHLLQANVMCNYLGYLGYLAVPAIGPMYTLHYDVPLTGGWAWQVKQAMDELGRVPRDNFPSLHTANTLIVLLVVRRYAPRLGWFYYPLGAGCIAATIYLRYHYTVDVLAGFVLGASVYLLVPYLNRLLRSMPEGEGVGTGGQ